MEGFVLKKFSIFKQIIIIKALFFLNLHEPDDNYDCLDASHHHEPTISNGEYKMIVTLSDALLKFMQTLLTYFFVR
jgi:hypothetical protein